MHQLKTLALATATAGLIGLVPFSAYAAEGDTSRALSEARQEGSIWTAIALNRHLNPFTIDVKGLPRSITSSPLIPTMKGKTKRQRVPNPPSRSALTMPL